MTAQQLIDYFGMTRIAHEGCWFALSYVSPVKLASGSLPARFGTEPRAAGSAIHALVTREDFSAMHRLAQDETWHFYQGDPIELLLLHPDGTDEVVVLGPDIVAGQRPQFTVPAGTWMGARPLPDAAAAWSLFGCTLTPAFAERDYVPGERTALIADFPERAALIEGLTR
ncbi:MAG: cupin domain-containing protein [Verrucomicrobiota bacterium]